MAPAYPITSHTLSRRPHRSQRQGFIKLNTAETSFPSPQIRTFGMRHARTLIDQAGVACLCQSGTGDRIGQSSKGKCRDAIMKHAVSQELYAYWQEQRGNRPAPERADIAPGPIRHVLSDVFILALDRGAGHPFRLAGTRVCALFGRELKGECFIELWTTSSRPIVSDLLAIVEKEQVGTVAGVTGQMANGDMIELELLLLPLAARTNLARTIGVLVPLQTPEWLGVNAIGTLAIGPRRHVGASIEERRLPRLMRPLQRRLTLVQGDRL
jgi:hypothetical protein